MTNLKLFWTLSWSVVNQTKFNTKITLVNTKEDLSFELKVKNYTCY